MGEFPEHGELKFTQYEPPAHECFTHGRHTKWLTFYGIGEPLPAYCMHCIVDVLDRQGVGKVYLQE